MAELEWEHRKRPQADENHDRPTRRAARAPRSQRKVDGGRKPRTLRTDQPRNREEQNRFNTVEMAWVPGAGRAPGGPAATPGTPRRA